MRKYPVGWEFEMKWTTLIGASMSRRDRSTESARLMCARPVIARGEPQPAPDSAKHVEPADCAIEELQRPATVRPRHLHDADQPMRKRDRHPPTQESPRQLAHNNTRGVLSTHRPVHGKHRER